MRPSIPKINDKLICENLLSKGFQFDQPVVLAIDCDRTIVDRKIGSHFINEDIVEALQRIANNPRFIIMINTGRDLASYSPLQKKLGFIESGLFLSGRVFFSKDRISILSKAQISSSFCRVLWAKLQDKKIPFLDVKYEKGNAFFSNDVMRSYYALYKPKDWLEGFQYTESKDEEEFISLKSARIEIPLLKKDHPELVDAINKKEHYLIEKLAISLFGQQESQGVQFIPLTIHPSRRDLGCEIAFLRAVVDGEKVNKGTGLQTVLKMLGISDSNLICFGDSAGLSASDSVIKKVIPLSTLLIVEDGDPDAIKEADFLIKSVSQSGVAEAISHIEKALN
jgi:HAD superfamily hydrolase (TIGR01484 family)